MSEKRLVARRRGSQLSIRIEESVYEEYKQLLSKEGISMTDDIDRYIKSRLGKGASANVVDLAQMAKDIDILKQQMGKLKVS